MPAFDATGLPVKRLSVVVPYRDRQRHQAMFITHLRSYFARDKADRAIPYRVTIVEQEPGLLFNRGALKNVGFHLTCGESDYTCFHDVDYLPIWADYSFTDCPTSIVWYGAEERPVVAGKRDAMIRHDLEQFFGAAVLIPNDQFLRVDGYSNEFWGWGYEDVDLRRRFASVGIGLGRRRGTFQPLDHDHEGYLPDGNPTDAARRNKALLDRHWTDGTPPGTDGLSTLDYEVIARRVLPDANPEREAVWETVKVRLRPSAS